MVLRKRGHFRSNICTGSGLSLSYPRRSILTSVWLVPDNAVSRFAAAAKRDRDGREAIKTTSLSSSAIVVGDILSIPMLSFVYLPRDNVIALSTEADLYCFHSKARQNHVAGQDT